ncbi:MAG: hypothetical protein PHW24_03895 [Candidatus Moranbacteria bacterium]|nr:hypothetical protein [Candidatus Moranbacteria bacterium]
MDKTTITKNLWATMFVVGFALLFFSHDAQADNPAVDNCTCSKNSVTHISIGNKIYTNSADSCNQYCTNQGATLFSYGAFSDYSPVTKTKGGSPYIAPHTCVCTTGAKVYTNLVIGTYAVSSEDACIGQCQISDPGMYNYDSTGFKSVPAKVVTDASATTPTPKQFDYPLLESFPGFFKAKDNLTDLPSLILAIYKFGIWTVGIAGFFMLVVGGFMYMGSAGNTSTAGSARGIIADALLGIVAALGAYLILYVINPELTKINISFTTVEVKFVNIDSSNPNSSTVCNDCVSVADICKESPCSLNKTLAGKLRTALNGQNARITEGWPATTDHSSSCHGNGTCADVNLTVNKGAVSDVKKLYDAIKATGLKPVYEDTAAGCAKYTTAGVYCHPYPTMTAPSFHVNM